ncbi:protein kinase family protein [Actinoplanes sp. CA-252034]|uniref:protein kinase family protein n=1 Tax=Actinoplanes sp. CA-252034 TaxID=3239906 RepID=UPI003D96DF96
MLDDLRQEFAEQEASSSLSRLYDDPEFGRMFAVLHYRLNLHFGSINERLRSGRHYWANNSRELIDLIARLREIRRDLKRSGIEIFLDERYETDVERCELWLSPSGGSSIPGDFEPIEIVKYEPVFHSSFATVKLLKRDESASLKMVGQGSYAFVYSYLDPNYGIKFAVKRAKKEIGDRDLARFRREFEIMKSLSFPYVLEVYQFNEERKEYRMEFCDDTLRGFIFRRNDKLSLSSRKRIALQFLYGMNYIHQNKVLHRDISLQNVLLKVYAGGAVLVKLSDFGLAKEHDSSFTLTQTEMRGTIRDPTLINFKDYGLPNEIYSIGWVLSYIFTGREGLKPNNDEVGRIVHKCAANDQVDRYRTVRDIIADVERLAAAPTDASA